MGFKKDVQFLGNLPVSEKLVGLCAEWIFIF